MVEFLGAEIPLPTFGIGTGAIVLAFSIFLIILAGAVIIYFVYMMRIYMIEYNLILELVGL